MRRLLEILTRRLGRTSTPGLRVTWPHSDLYPVNAETDAQREYFRWLSDFQATQEQ